MSDLTRKVVVNGVSIDLFDDEAMRRGEGTSRVFPIRATLDWLAQQTVAPQDPEALRRLREAGVEHVPLYLSEARTNGVEFAEAEPS